MLNHDYLIQGWKSKGIELIPKIHIKGSVNAGIFVYKPAIKIIATDEVIVYNDYFTDDEEGMYSNCASFAAYHLYRNFKLEQPLYEYYKKHLKEMHLLKKCYS